MSIETKLASMFSVAIAATAIAGFAIYVDRRIRRQRDDDDDATKGKFNLDSKHDGGVSEKAPRLQPSKTTVVATPAEIKGDKKLLVLISSFSANLQQKSHQDRALTILKGLNVRNEQMVTVDGAKPENREKRNALFGVSGIRAKYPQFFLVDAAASDTGSANLTFLADWEGFESMHEMGSLKVSMNLA